MFKVEYKKTYKNGKVYRPYIRFTDKDEAKRTLEYLKKHSKKNPGVDEQGEFWFEEITGDGKKVR